MPEVIAFDPGEATGFSRWYYTEVRPMTRIEAGVIPGGIDGFVHWLGENGHLLIDVVAIIEHYVQDGGPGDADAALQIEGALKYALAIHGAPPLVIQRRHDKRQVSDDLLREHHLYLSGADVDWEDGRDANDSEIHALAWAKKRGHMPTVAAFWPDR